MIAEFLRYVIPPRWRTWLRRSTCVNSAITWFVRKRQTRKHPHCNGTISFDGHRCLGWATGGLSMWEADCFRACELLLNHLQPRVIWDIGANVGIWAVYYGKAFPSVTTILAFEPDTTNIAMLRTNIHGNQLGDRISVRPVALSAEAGTSSFQVDSFTGSMGTLETMQGFRVGPSGRPVVVTEVPVSTIDDELRHGAACPQFIKVDVEGHEHAVFRGGTEMLRVCRPILMVEFSGAYSEEALRMVERHGYAFVRPRDGTLAKSPEYELFCVPCERVTEVQRLLTPERSN